jgi:hypothetical protein
MYTHSPLSLGHWSAVHGGCSMNYAIRDGSKVDFMFGEPSGQYFELAFDTAAFREFVTLAGQALRKLDAQGGPDSAKAPAELVPDEAMAAGQEPA